MKKDLREVYWAPNRASAEAAIDVFAEKYRAKYGMGHERSLRCRCNSGLRRCDHDTGRLRRHVGQLAL